jgi:hypothetical protein
MKEASRLRIFSPQGNFRTIVDMWERGEVTQATTLPNLIVDSKGEAPHSSRADRLEPEKHHPTCFEVPCFPFFSSHVSLVEQYGDRVTEDASSREHANVLKHSVESTERKQHGGREDLYKKGQKLSGMLEY